MYLVIENVGTCSVEAITTLGLSSTRLNQSENYSLIGMFGTGAKHSFNVLLRKGLTPTIYLGRLKVELYTKAMEVNTLDGKFEEEIVWARITGQDENGRQINRNEDLKFSVNMGEMDWTETSMALRDLLSNAIDASIKLYGNTSGTKVELTPNTRAKAGITRIYVPADEEVRDFYVNLPNKFLHFAYGYKPDQEVIVKKGCKPEGPRFYRRGVLVGQIEDEAGLFDYNIKDLNIDESRNIQVHAVKHSAAQVLAKAEPSILERLLQSTQSGQTYYEHTLDSYYLRSANIYNEEESNRRKINWQTAFKKVFPVTEQTIMVDDNVHLQEYVKNRGFNLVIIPQHSIYKTLRAYGIKSYEAISMDLLEGKITEDAPNSLIEHVKACWAYLKTIGSTLEKPAPLVKVFSAKTDGNEKLFGYWRDNTIYVNKDVLSNDPSEQLLQVIFEELAHYVSGATDLSRDFQNYMFSTLVKAYKKG